LPSLCDSFKQEFCAKGKSRPSYTIQSSVKREGQGLFTGASASLTLLPACRGSGIVFQRMDLPGQPSFRADLSLVQGTPRCTIIGKEGVSVQTVEHLMAALHAYEMDHLLIQLSGPEVPIFDGSSLAFIEMIEQAGIAEQEEERVIYSLQNPICWSEGDIHLVACPSEELRVSYTLHYPRCSRIGTQFCSIALNKNSFKEKIAPCRTFSVYEEIAPLIERGVLQGGSLDNAVVIKENKVLNPEGLRFEDEMVRHKILDLLGDLYLMGVSFRAHILAVRSGHSSNIAFARELLTHITREGGV